MAFGSKTNKETKKDFGVVSDVKIIRAINNDYGCFFDMALNGVKINGCTVRETKDGRYFISLPQKKGGDNNYYPIVSFYFSNDDQDKILQLVQDKLNEMAK